MSGGDRKPGEGRKEKTCGACHIRGKTLVFFQFYHIHAYCFYNAVASDRSPQRHYQTAENHKPQRDLEGGYIVLSACKKNSQHEYTHKFLSVLRSMHKGHSRTSGDLCASKKTGCPTPIHIPTG